jgi:exosortase
MRLNWLQIVSMAAAGMALLVLILLLAPAWWSDPELAHGMFIPPVFALILVQTWRQAVPPARSPNLTLLKLLMTIAGLAALASLLVAGVYAVVLTWTHDLVLFLLTLSVVSLLAAIWSVLAAPPGRVFPLQWPLAAGLLLWLLASPMPPGTIAQLSLHLQGAITHGIVLLLHALSIPAVPHGHVIELSTTRVFMDEACSGIRSLITCTAAGLAFSALLVRRPMARLLLIALAPLLAIAMNFLRALVLTLLAASGRAIDGAWHDQTGYLIAILVSLALAGLAWRLEPTPGSPPALTP